MPAFAPLARAAAACASLLVGAAAANGAPQLAIDPAAIASSEGVGVQLGPVTKDPKSPFFGEDEPWDVAWWNTYPTAAYDPKEKKYKLWYDGVGDCGCAKGKKTCTVADGGLSTAGMCPHLKYNYSTTFGKGGPGFTYYAESTDGVTWTKPSLGQVEFGGSKANNIVLSTTSDPNRGVFLDEHETNSSRRYKMFGVLGAKGSHTLPGRGGVATLVSADGKVWTDIASASSMAVAADTANNALYDKDLKKYIAFSRNHCNNARCNASGWGNRRETRSVSSTWEGGWSKATEVLHGEHVRIPSRSVVC